MIEAKKEGTYLITIEVGSAELALFQKSFVAVSMELLNGTITEHGRHSMAAILRVFDESLLDESQLEKLAI